MTAAHGAAATHSYYIHYPEHPARSGDPHYVDFHHYHRANRAAARCYIGERIGLAECRTAQGDPALVGADGVQAGLELHHSHVEFSLQNGVSLTALEVDYPGISDTMAVGAWIETAANLRWYCAWHHRGPGGAHSAAHSDFEAAHYVAGLLGPPTNRRHPHV